jgi:hypothetical protein
LNAKIELSANEIQQIIAEHLEAKGIHAERVVLESTTPPLPMTSSALVAIPRVIAVAYFKVGADS